MKEKAPIAKLKRKEQLIGLKPKQGKNANRKNTGRRKKAVKR